MTGREALLRKTYPEAMLKVLRPEINKSNKKSFRHFREGFYHGYGCTVAGRIKDAHAQAMADANDSTALVHINKDEKLVKEEIAGKCEQCKVRSRTAKSDAGISAGAKAGESVVLNRNVLEAA